MEPAEISNKNDEQISPFGELVATADGSLTIRHPLHLETYHSTAGAETEARELYINSSGILNCFAAGNPTQVLDVGLGLSYNAMATIDAWLDAESSGALVLTSLESCPGLVEALRAGQAGWTGDWSVRRMDVVAALLNADQGHYFTEIIHPVSGAVCRWTILIGDARNTLANIAAQYQFIWQDPFSPEKNPEMWSENWFTSLRSVCASDAVLMSYSVARSVRDALTAAGWQVERFKTPLIQKRNWLRARSGDGPERKI